RHHGPAPRQPADPRRAVPPGEHRDRARARPAAQLPDDRHRKRSDPMTSHLPTQAGPSIKQVLAAIAAGETLSEDDAQHVFELLMAGDVTPSQMGGLLMGLRVRGETVAEITGAARAMRARALTVQAPDGAIDTCGTGGDA